MTRAPGMSLRLRLTLSYAGLVMLAGVVLLTAGWLFLTRARHVGLIFEPGYQNSVLRDFAPVAVGVMTFLLVFGLVGGWLLAGRMLAPLARITEATRLASAGSLSHRIALEGPADELRELADAFDGMLERLGAQVAEQQRFAVNASHELRTPLAITQTLLDVARADPYRDADALIDRLRSVNARAIDLTEALLLLSRAGRRSFTAQPVDLSLAAEEATETLLPLAERYGVGLETAGDLAVTPGSEPLLLQLTTNLVHNAIVHNVPGGTVWVTTSADADGVALDVENTGPPVSPVLAATLVEPFQRGTRARTAHDGVGLGLAIVERIAAVHDGTLTLTPRSTGGLRATVHLPASADTLPAASRDGQDDPSRWARRPA